MNKEINFCKSTKITGRNKLGKSTIMKSWFWLLSSYTDAYTVKNFELFDSRTELTPDTPYARVIATIEIDGIEYTLERNAQSKFVRKKGSDTYEKASSDSYGFRIDNIEVSSSAFTNWIETNICPSNMIQYLIDGSFFAELVSNDKEKAKKIMEEVVGSVNMNDMKGDYSILKEDLMKFSVDMIEERTKKEIKPYNEKIKEIPSIIKTKENTVYEYEREDFEQILNDINSKKKEISDIDNVILGNGESIKPILGIRDGIFHLINEKNIELNRRKNEYNNKHREKINELKGKIEDIKNVKKEIELNKNRIKSIESTIDFKNKSIKSLEAQKNELMAKLKEIKERKFSGEKCVYCGQTLPEDKLSEAKKEFNEAKKKEYDNTVLIGKTIKDQIENEKIEIQKLIESKDLYTTTPDENIDDSKLVESIKELNDSFIVFENTEEYSAYLDEIKRLESSVPSIPDNNNALLTEKKKALMADLDSLNRIYGLKEKADIIRGEIAELNEQKRMLFATVAMLEGKIRKCQEYKQERANIMSDRINKNMNECHIEMWSMQKDGNLVPDVVIKDNEGIKYMSLNTSNKIRVCIDLQKLFMVHYGIKLPIFIDEYSIFDDINAPKEEGVYQVIKLCASNDDFIKVTYEDTYGM